jgi:hypothetical protein
MMSKLNPDKLNVTFQAGTFKDIVQFPRRYTLTHSDATGDLFLFIGAQYDQKQVNGLYTRLMRDEVLAELKDRQGETSIHVYVHVSGGFIFGTASWRNNILHHHLPMVLEAFRYGDQELFTAHPELDDAKIYVHFAAKQSRFNQVEEWGQIKKYR